MAIKVAQTTGAWSTAGIWYTGTETEVAAGTMATSSTRYSKVFTAPNTTNACTGGIVWFTAISTAAHSPKLELEEYDGVSAWVSKASHTITNTHTVFDNNRFFSGSSTVTAIPIYFRFDTPFTYTTTTAGYYRFKLSGGTSATYVYSGTSGASSILWAVIVDDRTGVPTPGSDDVWIVGDETTETVVTLDSSLSVGSGVGSETVTIVNTPIGTKALIHGYNGTLTFGESADTTLTINGGHLITNGGGLHIGTVASPYPAAYNATILYNPISTYGFGAIWTGYDTTQAKVSLVGATKTYKTLYAAGDGAAATPMTVDSITGWRVGDRLWLSHSTYSSMENRYIVAIGTTGPAAITDYSGTVPGTVLVTDTAHGLLTGMKVDITGTTDYNGTAITITVVDANSYYFTDTYTSDQVGTWTATTPNGLVLSTTAGGAPAALSNAHAVTDWVLNSTRNVKLTTTTPATTWFYGFNYFTSSSSIKYKYCEFDGIGGNASSRYYWQLTSNARHATYMEGCSYISRSTSSTLTMPQLHTVGSSNPETTIKDTIVVGLYQHYSSSPINIGNNAGTYQNLYALGGLYNGISLYGSNFTLDGGHVRNSVSNYSTTNAYGGIVCISGDNIKANNCTVDGCRAVAIQIRTGTNWRFNNCAFGTIYANGAAQLGVGDIAYSTAIFDTCDWGAETLFYTVADTTGVAVNVPGSSYAFQNFDSATENFKHRWYQPYGTAYKCGVDMEDTTVTPLSQNCVRIDPINDDVGFCWTFRVLAVPDQAVSVFGKLKKSAEATADEATVELYLPGSTTADATDTLPAGTDWNTWSVTANYTGDSYSWATVKICCKSITTDAKFYIGDIYNGTNDITNLNLWYDGKPSEIMFEQLGDANAVWAVLSSTQTTDGTMGKQAVDTLTAARFAGAVAAS